MTSTERAVDPRLIDRFGRRHSYLRISVTDRCNLRCTYCMPPEGIDWQPKEQLLTYEEIHRMARVFVQLGIRKIRITGGEPMARQELERLLAMLSPLPGLETLAMTTNAVYLAPRARALKAAGLHQINISLDTLRPDRFIAIAKRDQFHAVMAGIEAALSVGFDSIKLNAVIMAGVNEDEVLDFVHFVADKPINLRLIEYMPFKDNQWSQAGVVPYARMRAEIERHFELIPATQDPSDVARDFVIPGHQGKVSFITSMTDSFCSTCNRLRLTADGSIKSCLFHPAETNVREALRRGASDAELAERIAFAVQLKEEAHPPMDELVSVDNRAMIQIGG
jgi:cyclic pyranopterin phosphate synthase